MELGTSFLPLVEEALNERDDLGLESRAALVELKDRMDGEMWKPEVKTHNDLIRSRIARIQRICRTVRNDYRISLSHPKKPSAVDCMGAPADGLVPLASVGSGFPRLTWHPAFGEAGWLQYDFPDKQTINSAEVFWYVAGKSATPESWKVQYQDEEGRWKDVEGAGVYGLESDRWNRVRFDEVETRAVRLAIEMRDDHTAGLYEFRVAKR